MADRLVGRAARPICAYLHPARRATAAGLRARPQPRIARNA